MRFTLLLTSMLLAVASSLQSEDWSGSFEVVETLTGVAVSGDAKREVEATARALEERVARTREALKTAKPALAKALKQDLAALEIELESVALERGGTVVIGRTLYLVAPGRVVADGDEGRVVADTAAVTAVVVAGGRRETVTLVKPEKSSPPRDAVVGTPMAGAETMRGTITVDGQPVTVSWASSLPNVYALTRLSAHGDGSLQAQLASLPGLPMAIERPNPKGGTLRWTVEKLTPGPIEPRLLAP